MLPFIVASLIALKAFAAHGQSERCILAVSSYSQQHAGIYIPSGDHEWRKMDLEGNFKNEAKLKRYAKGNSVGEIPGYHLINEAGQCFHLYFPLEFYDESLECFDLRNGIGRDSKKEFLFEPDHPLALKQRPSKKVYLLNLDHPLSPPAPPFLGKLTANEIKELPGQHFNIMSCQRSAVNMGYQAFNWHYLSKRCYGLKDAIRKEEGTIITQADSDDHWRAMDWSVSFVTRGTTAERIFVTSVATLQECYEYAVKHELQFRWLTMNKRSECYMTRLEDVHPDPEWRLLNRPHETASHWYICKKADETD